MFQKVEVL